MASLGVGVLCAAWIASSEMRILNTWLLDMWRIGARAGGSRGGTACVEAGALAPPGASASPSLSELEDAQGASAGCSPCDTLLRARARSGVREGWLRGVLCCEAFGVRGRIGRAGA